MLTEKDCDDIQFRWLPALYWKPAPMAAIRACNLDVFRRWEIFCFGWLLMEIEFGAFRAQATGEAQ